METGTAVRWAERLTGTVPTGLTTSWIQMTWSARFRGVSAELLLGFCDVIFKSFLGLVLGRGFLLAVVAARSLRRNPGGLSRDHWCGLPDHCFNGRRASLFCAASGEWSSLFATSVSEKTSLSMVLCKGSLGSGSSGVLDCSRSLKLLLLEFIGFFSEQVQVCFVNTN